MKRLDMHSGQESATSVWQGHSNVSQGATIVNSTQIPLHQNQQCGDGHATEVWFRMLNSDAVMLLASLADAVPGLLATVNNVSSVRHCLL